MREILQRHKKGTLLNVYVFTIGGPAYIGQFIVDRSTIREVSTNRAWGRVKREYKQKNGKWLGEIVKVEPTGKSGVFGNIKM